MQEVLISVIIPTYNRLSTLPRAVESVLSQSYDKIELLIVDDCSADGTKEYVEGLADQRVVYIKNERNLGAAASRNRGAKLAKGELLAFQDSDDEWLPDKLRKSYERFVQAHAQGAELVYHEMIENNGVQDEPVPSREIPDCYKEEELAEYLLLYPMIGIPAVLVSKECFLSCGGFREELRSMEDYEFSVRFSRQYGIAFLKEPLIRVHNSEDSVNKDWKSKIDAAVYVLYQYRQAYWERELFATKLGIVCMEAANYNESEYCYRKLSETFEGCRGEEKELFWQSFEEIAAPDDILLQSDVAECGRSLLTMLQHMEQSLEKLFHNLKANPAAMLRGAGIREALADTAQSIEGYCRIEAAEGAYWKSVKETLLSGSPDGAALLRILQEMQKELRDFIKKAESGRSVCPCCGALVKFLPPNPYGRIKARYRTGSTGKNKEPAQAELDWVLCPFCGKHVETGTAEKSEVR